MKTILSIFAGALAVASVLDSVQAVTFDQYYSPEFTVELGTKGANVHCSFTGVSGTATYTWLKSIDSGTTWTAINDSRLMFYGQGQLLWKASSNGAERIDRALYCLKIVDAAGTWYGPYQKLFVQEPEVTTATYLKFYNSSNVLLSSLNSVDNPTNFTGSAISFPSTATYVKAGIYVINGMGPFRYSCRHLPSGDSEPDAESTVLAGYSTADTTDTYWEQTITKSAFTGEQEYIMNVHTPDQVADAPTDIVNRLGYGVKVFILAH